MMNHPASFFRRSAASGYHCGGLYRGLPPCGRSRDTGLRTRLGASCLGESAILTDRRRGVHSLFSIDVWPPTCAPPGRGQTVLDFTDLESLPAPIVTLNMTTRLTAWLMSCRRGGIPIVCRRLLFHRPLQS